MTNQIETNKERIDETLDTITMSKAGWVHINMFNHQRDMNAGTYVKASVPAMVAPVVTKLDEMLGSSNLVKLIELCRHPKHKKFYEDWEDELCICEKIEEEEDWDRVCSRCKWDRESDTCGMHDLDIQRFYDLCVGIHQVQMMGLPDEWLGVAIEFVNRNRDFLIDDESDDERYIGRFTKVREDYDGRYFPLAEAQDILPEGYNQPKRDEEE